MCPVAGCSAPCLRPRWISSRHGLHNNLASTRCFCLPRPILQAGSWQCRANRSEERPLLFVSGTLPNCLKPPWPLRSSGPWIPCCCIHRSVKQFPLRRAAPTSVLRLNISNYVQDRTPRTDGTVNPWHGNVGRFPFATPPPLHIHRLFRLLHQRHYDDEQ